jgi:pyrroloquinoline quinone biosynthesis protein B
VIVAVLGSAAGGGVPQWNCRCANCAAARAGVRPRRLQSGAAVSADGKRWLLLNCSPDVAAQVEAYPALQPMELRGTPIEGMLFTDANVDHIGGLATLRQSGEHRFTIRSSDVIRDIAVAQPAFAPFARAPHRWLEVPLDAPCAPAGDRDLVGNELEVRAIAVPGTTPGFDGRRTARGAVVAYEIRARSDAQTFLFAPVFAAVDDALAAALRRADVAMLDGSFYSDDEMLAAGVLQKTARSLGHQPVGDAGGTLEALRGTRARAIFTHVNNSNPMLDPASEAARTLAEAGVEVAYDGMELRLE